MKYNKFIDLISSILSNQQNATVQKSEKTLAEFRSSAPNEFVLSIIQILKTDPRPPFRIFSAQQLRSYLMSEDQSVCIDKWEKLSGVTQIKMKMEMFLTLRKEVNPEVQRRIAAAMAAIAVAVHTKDQKAWPEFEINVGRLLMDQSQNLLMASLIILESFILSVPSYFMERSSALNQLISRCLSHDSKEVKLSGLSFFSACLKSLNPKKYRLIYEHSSSIYNTVYVIYKDHNSEEGIDALVSMLKTSSKYFKRSLKQLINLFSSIFRQSQCQEETQIKILKILFGFMLNGPKPFTKDKLIIKTILGMVFSFMIETNTQITYQWENPFEGFEDVKDDPSFSKAKFCMDLISAFIIVVGEEVVVPLLLTQCSQRLKKQDWRHQYAAIMAISQTGEYLKDNSALKIGEIFSFFEHPHAKVRYAACHAIGQIFTDLPDKLQTKLGGNVFSKMISFLQKEHIPIVISHAAAAFSNVIDEITYEDISSKDFGRAVRLLLKLSAHEISLVRECTITALSSILQLSKQHYRPHLTKTLNVMLGYLESRPKPFVVNKLVGEIIELLTIAAENTSSDAFQPFLSKLTNHLVIAQKSLDVEHPHKKYVVRAWHRLCLIYGREISKTIFKVLPGLLNLAEGVIKNELGTFADRQDATSSLSEFIDDQCAQTEAKYFIDMFGACINEMKQQFTPYSDRTAELFFRLINEPCRSEVKETVCQCLPLLIEAAQEQDPESAIDLVKHFASRLLQAVERQNNPSILVYQIDTISAITQKCSTSFLQDKQLYPFSQRLLSIFNKIEDKKDDIIKQIQEGTSEGDEIQHYQLAQVNLTVLCGQLLRLHKEKALPLANEFIRSIIPKAVKAPSIHLPSVYVYFISDAVEHLGYRLLSKDWKNFGDALMKHIHSRNCSLRQGACYGLGVYAERTPAFTLKEETVRKWLQGLQSSIGAQPEDEEQNIYGNCRDNAISAYGKIIHAKFGSVDLMPQFRQWLKLLPLEYDSKERERQNQILIKLMTHHFERIIKIISQEERDQSIAKIIEICDEIGNEEGQNKEELIKMAQELSLKLNEIFEST